jgi:hypothetical protein
MREFTKSMTSYTWAMSMFGLQQMINVFRPGKATESFNNVTKATEEEFGDALKATFRAGDNLQRGLVDVTFGALTLGMFNRGGSGTTADIARQTAEALRQGGRAVSQTAEAVTRTVQAGTSAATSAAQQTAGWATAQSTSQNAQTQQRNNAPKSSTGTSGRGQGWGPMPNA